MHSGYDRGPTSIGVGPLVCRYGTRWSALTAVRRATLDLWRYLGTIRPPAELETLRPPVIRGDTILGITTDDIGAQYVLELHLDPAR